MPRYVIGLDERAALVVASAGGKGSNLARLRRAGFNVPPGFVITPLACEALMDGAPRRSAEASPSQVRIAVDRAITRSYARLSGPVAVRSSLPSEDGAGRSYAGQLDTVLNVEGQEDLRRAIGQCWASLRGQRLASYDHAAVSAADQSPAMAVVVQRMVDAVAAGVAFSADPLTGRRCVVIEGAPGLGDAVVGGRVDPDRYVVDEQGKLDEVRPVNPAAPVLSEAQVLALAGTVRRVAGVMGQPQDVEWAWDGATFHLLQARPITTLVGQRVYSNRMVSDMAPGLIKPLIYSTASVGVARDVFGRIFRKLIGPNDVDFTRLVTRIHSRLYTDMTLLGELMAQVGLPPNILEMMIRQERAESRRHGMPMGSLPGMLRVTKFAWHHGRLGREIDAFVAQWQAEVAPLLRADLSSATRAELIAALDRLVVVLGDVLWHFFMAYLNMAGRHRMLVALVERWAPGVEPGDLVCGLVGLKGLEPNAEIRRLAGLARALPPDEQVWLFELDDPGLRAALSKSATGAALVHELSAFLDRYGYLSPSGTDFSSPPWCDNPVPIWRAIGRAAGAPPDEPHTDTPAVREAARQRVRARLSPWRRALFDRALASTSAYIARREEISLLTSQNAHILRRHFLALAGQLVADGILAQQDDLFYLAFDEVRDLVAGRLPAADAQESIAARRTQMTLDATVEPPPTIRGEQFVPEPISPPGAFLSGIAGSAGTVQGYARVVLDPALAPALLGRQDILVVPFTDVGWTPLFAGVGGIVAETGGQLSHSAIVAREYGLPAVVSVKHATQLISEGQPLTLYGERGRVYLSHVVP